MLVNVGGSARVAEGKCELRMGGGGLIAGQRRVACRSVRESLPSRLLSAPPDLLRARGLYLLMSDGDGSASPEMVAPDVRTGGIAQLCGDDVIWRMFGRCLDHAHHDLARLLSDLGEEHSKDKSKPSHDVPTFNDLRLRIRDTERSVRMWSQMFTRSDFDDLTFETEIKEPLQQLSKTMAEVIIGELEKPTSGQQFQRTWRTYVGQWLERVSHLRASLDERPAEEWELHCDRTPEGIRAGANAAPQIMKEKKG